MRIAVSGKEGQVVRALIERAATRGHEIVAVGRPELDLTDAATVLPALAAARPELVISAGAYTAVDKAESDPETAFSVNAKGARALARAARELGVPLVHLSTDYVFDGAKDAPYTESDPVGPAGVYGASKLAGERAIAEEYGANSAILRTAWVYSPFGANFVKTMLRLAGDRDEVGVVADQFGNPTSALDIADAVLAVAEGLQADLARDLRGVFHMTAQGEANWADFAEAIFAASKARGGPHARVRRITTADFPTPARRPANSRLDCNLLASTYGIRLPEWRKSTETVVERLLASADK